MVYEFKKTLEGQIKPGSLWVPEALDEPLLSKRSKSTGTGANLPVPTTDHLNKNTEPREKRKKGKGI